MVMNGTMMQYFEWYIDADGKHWQRLKEDAAHLHDIGITAVWIPPVFKGVTHNDEGYGIYDLYDLGEFDQKGGIRTKYGTKQELLDAIEELHKYGIQVYADVVLNHKGGADETERFMAVEVAEDDRNKEISEPYEIEGWTKFTFPGRQGKYSDFIWNYHHFSGIDYDQINDKKSIFRIAEDGKSWADDSAVANEFGNYDYLMFADIDYDNADVVNEVKNWASWFIKETGVDGFRLDAVKHIHADFINDLVCGIREEFGEDFFVVAEYWDQKYGNLKEYLNTLDEDISLFDVSLHYKLSNASKEGNAYDLRPLFDETLMQKRPTSAVTFVDNHDSQPSQALESYVEPWFKPLAYSIILLRKYGYPTVFYGDYYGLKGENPIDGQPEILDKLICVRKNYAYGEQVDYIDHANCIGWTRSGDEDHPDGLAVVLSNSEEGFKEMSFGEERAGEVFYDYLGHRQDEVTLDENGVGIFPVNAGSVSAWVKKVNE